MALAMNGEVFRLSSSTEGMTYLPFLQLVLLLDAPADEEVAVLVEVAEIAGAQAAVGGEDRRVLLGRLW